MAITKKVQLLLKDISNNFKIINEVEKMQDKGIFYCNKCNTYFTTSLSYIKRKIKEKGIDCSCPNCIIYNKDYEEIVLEALKSLNIDYIFYQYKYNGQLKSDKNYPLSSDFAIYYGRGENKLRCIIEANDYHHYTCSNKGELKTNYKSKKNYCYKNLIPLIELDYRVLTTKLCIKKYIIEKLKVADYINSINNIYLKRQEYGELFFSLNF